MSAERGLPMDIEKSLKFEIVTGERKGSELTNVVPIGIATHRTGDEYYVLNLKSVVPRKLYLVKNEDSQEDYTVFCGYDQTKTEGKFMYPCGSGVLSKDLQSYMEIDLYPLSYSVFMCLYPTKEAA